MKISKYLESEAKELSGSLLGIGIEYKNLIDSIEKNNNIKICNLLNSYSKKTFEKGKNETIKINKLRKKFKKNKTDYTICNISTIQRFQNKFIYDSIYINKRHIYLYIEDKEIDSNFINKYRRCKAEVHEIECDNGYVYSIDLSNVKIGIIKEKVYKIFDIFIEGSNLITEFLIN